MPARSAFSIQRSSLFAVILSAALISSALIGGCGSSSSSSSSDNTYTVSGIVVSYPSALTRAVTLSDLTPVGAGVTIQMQEHAGLDSNSTTYYHSHPLPVTDAKGRFTVRIDRSFRADVDSPGIKTNPEADVVVGDRCSTANMVHLDNGNVSANTEIAGASQLSHYPHQQMLDAGTVARGHFNADVVIVATDNTDACGQPVINLTY